MSLDDPFFPALVRLGQETSVPSEWYLALLYLESRFQPEICNAYGYCGLNQMSSKYLRDSLHIDPADYRTWSASRQLTEVIAPWYKRVIHDMLGTKIPRSPGVLYALNLYPASVKNRGDRPETKIIDGSSSDAYERKAYEANKALDVNKNGAIEIVDLDQFLAGLTKQAAYQKELTRLRAVSGGEAPVTPGTTESHSWGWLPWAAVAGVGVFAAVKLRGEGSGRRSQTTRRRAA